ncbi:hypothetical protein L195_g012213 [Trifolium pratense]|uniref:Uncharacterized protein n=1 Tax=Trifolium pratense TaxID=57577 RepID=A0A2K3PJQ3_TRIPR|nr:hypothetical protein L195_g012213 [Trifolium pratense]
MKDLKKKRKIDEAGSSNLVSKEEELRLLIEPLAKPGRRINEEYAYPSKGGGGQSFVPPKAALPVPPRYVEGYTYPQTSALYAAHPYPYP